MMTFFLCSTFVKVPSMFSFVFNGMDHKNDAIWTGLMGLVSQTVSRGVVAFLQVGFEKENLWKSSWRLVVVWYICNRWGLEFEWDWCCISWMLLLGNVCYRTMGFKELQDPTSKNQGPFLSVSIISRFKQGFFGMNLLVRLSDAPEGMPFHDLDEEMNPRHEASRLECLKQWAPKNRVVQPQMPHISIDSQSTFLSFQDGSPIHLNLISLQWDWLTMESIFWSPWNQKVDAMLQQVLPLPCCFSLESEVLMKSDREITRDEMEQSRIHETVPSSSISSNPIGNQASILCLLP